MSERRIHYLKDKNYVLGEINISMEEEIKSLYGTIEYDILENQRLLFSRTFLVFH